VEGETQGINLFAINGGLHNTFASVDRYAP
jgi:hypothetical protein